MYRRIIPILLVSLLIAVPVLAQDEAPKSEAFEHEALTHESRGRYAEALESYKRAFQASLEEAAAAPEGEARARRRADAEFQLEKIGTMTEKTSSFRETGKFLEGVATGGPDIESLVRWNRARSLVAEGRLDEARALLGDLGFVTDWWIIGSFDNERGGGFGKAYPPEADPIDLAARMKGKEHEVGWRRIRYTPVFGYVDLDALFRPNDQCLAYAAAWIECPDDRPAAVRVGSDESIRVWVNGEEALARDLRRDCGFDQDAAGVTLRKGWNRVLVKVGDQTGDWGFRLRFTTPDGSPMTDLAVGNDRAKEAEAAVRERGAPAAEIVAPDVARGARGTIEKLLAEDRATAREIFHLGVLHRMREYEDRNERKALEILKQAEKVDAENAFLAFALSRAAERKSEAVADREENDRRQYLEKAIGLDPDFAVAWYFLAHYYTYSLPIYEKAERNLKRALEINPLFLDARLLEVDLLRRRGYGPEADYRLTKLLEVPEFSKTTAFLERKADRAADRARVEESESLLTDALGIDWADGSARSRLARTLEAAARPDEVLKLYDDEVRLNPLDLDALKKKAMLLEGMGRLEEAAETALAALRICPEEDSLLNQIGRIYHKSGEDEKALGYWKEALTLNPKEAKLRRYVEFVDPESRPFEDAFPAEIDDLLARAKEFTSTENDPWLNVLDQQIDKVNQDGTSSSFTRRIVKILNDQGANAFDRHAARHDPREQSVHFELARVIHPDGTEEQGRIMRGYMADLPPLKPGDIVHLEYRVDTLKKSFFGDYFGEWFYFGDWRPGFRSEYIVIAPADKELFFHTRNVEVEPKVTAGPEGRTKIFTFTVNDPEKIRQEPVMPSPREVFPQLVVSSYGSWEDFARWYWNLIKGQFRITDEMKEKVAELTKDKATRYEKIHAIYDHVITDVRYDSSWEFGVHGYKPYDASAIWSRKFGDCKDKAILLHTLLEEIGVEAYPVLINATAQRWDEDLALPLVGHFNHAIAYVPDVDGEGRGLFLDGTAQYCSMESTPGMDQGAQVLVVTPEGGERMQVPWGSPEGSGMSQRFEAELKPDGSAELDATLSFTGDMAAMIRRVFSVEGQRPLALNMMLGRMFGQAKLKTFEFSDLETLTDPRETLTATIDVPRFAETTARGLELKITMNPSNLSSLAAAKERHYDMILTTPQQIVNEGVYRLPEGFRVVSLPEPRHFDHPWGLLEVTYEQDEGEVRFSQVLEFRQPRIPKEDYEKFREFANALDLVSKDRIVIAKQD